MNKFFFLVSLSFVFTGQARSQSNESVQKAAMQKLTWLVGNWKGESKYTTGGKPEQGWVKEKIEWALDSTVLIIKGLGGKGDHVHHDALAVLSYDVASGKYQWKAWRIPGGNYTEYPLEVGEGSFAWSMAVKGGTARYKAWLENGEWVETGEFQQGEKWYKFLDMRLAKQ